MANSVDKTKKGKDFFKLEEKQNDTTLGTRLEKDVFSQGEIQNLKQKIEGLNPQKLIEEALKLSRKPEEKKEKKDEFLETMKANAVKSFLDNIKNKSLREVNVEFEKKIDDYNKTSLLYKDKIDKEKY
jgi:hypothetical protein